MGAESESLSPPSTSAGDLPLHASPPHDDNLAGVQSESMSPPVRGGVNVQSFLALPLLRFGATCGLKGRHMEYIRIVTSVGGSIDNIRCLEREHKPAWLSRPSSLISDCHSRVQSAP